MKKTSLVALLIIFLMFGATTVFSETPFRLGVVLSIGGLGDKTFNDATYVGIKNLRAQPQILIDVVEPSDIPAIEDALEYLSKRKLDLIVAVGLFANEAVRKVSKRHPELKFALIDSVVTARNVLSILFNEEEGSFYAGALAGLLTKSQKVGFLGGMVSPVIKAFEKGFTNGARFVNPSVEVLVKFIGETPDAFQNPEAGGKLGRELAEKGADVIYHAAGGSGLGLIESARRGNFLVIGVDSDQSAIVPGKIPASMVKRMDVALDRACHLVKQGKFAGGVLTLGLRDQGVGLILSKFNQDLFSPLIKERLKEVEEFLLRQ